MKVRPVLVALIGLAVVAGAGAARLAEAHALLVRAEPAVNASLREPPRELVLYFSEPLESRFSSVTVIDHNGRRPEQTVSFDDAGDAVMRVALGPTEPGFLVVSWETVSVVDGHRITGSYPLTILNPDGTLPSVEPPALAAVEGESARADLGAVRFVQFGGAALLVGSLLFLLWVAPAVKAGGETGDAPRRLSLYAACVALPLLFVAGVFELVIQASEIGSGARTVLETRWGERWLIRHAALGGVLLLLVAHVLTGRRKVPAGGALAAAAVSLGAISSTSHAAAGTGAFWATAADLVHLLAASVWIGMLALLAALYARTRRAGSMRTAFVPALQRFSVAAAVSLALLLVAGTISAVVELARPNDLIASAYGRTLLLKLAIVLPLLAVAAYNAYALRPRLAAQEADARLERRFGWTLRAEIALAAAVLLVVAFLVQMTPTRATGGEDAISGFTAGRSLEEYNVSLSVQPARPGINSFEVALQGDTSLVEQVRLEFFDRSGGTSESRLVLDGDGGLYTGQGPFLDKAGDWQVRVNVRQSQGSDLSLPFDLSIEDAGAGRGGAFESPVDWTIGRALIVAMTAALVFGLLAASLAGGREQGGYAGALLRRLTGSVSRDQARRAAGVSQAEEAE